MSLALTIARAHRWRELLKQGRYRSIRSLALALGVDNSYAARLLRRSLLAPDMWRPPSTAQSRADSPGEALSPPDEWERQRVELSAPLHR